MNEATKARKAALATTTTMVRDGIIYHHNPATVGHAKHNAGCWVDSGNLLAAVGVALVARSLGQHRLLCRCESDLMPCHLLPKEG